MKFFSKLAETIKPYTAGEQPQDKKYIKLNTNENPYPPSSLGIESLKDFDYSSLTKYPDPNCLLLRKEISQRLNIEVDNVFVGNGSDEVLAFAFGSFFDKDDYIAINDITYSFYPVYSAFYQIKTKILPLLNYRVDVSAYQNLDCKGIVLANPNAPTSIALTRADIEKIIVWNRNKVVIVDEAYVDFCDETVEDLIATYDNLLVIKTFSKSYSLAGARCGYALGNASLIDGLNRIKNSFNSYTVNAMTQALALASYKDTAYFISNVNKVKDTRDRTINALLVKGYNVLPSDTNFLFLGHPNAKDRYLKLKENGILVRYFDKPLLGDFMRVTIGTDQDMEEFLRVLFKLDSLC